MIQNFVKISPIRKFINKKDKVISYNSLSESSHKNWVHLLIYEKFEFKLIFKTWRDFFSLILSSFLGIYNCISKEPKPIISNTTSQQTILETEEDLKEKEWKEIRGTYLKKYKNSIKNSDELF